MVLLSVSLFSVLFVKKSKSPKCRLIARERECIFAKELGDKMNAFFEFLFVLVRVCVCVVVHLALVKHISIHPSGNPIHLYMCVGPYTVQPIHPSIHLSVPTCCHHCVWMLSGIVGCLLHTSGWLYIGMSTFKLLPNNHFSFFPKLMWNCSDSLLFFFFAILVNFICIIFPKMNLKIIRYIYFNRH